MKKVKDEELCCEDEQICSIECAPNKEKKEEKKQDNQGCGGCC